MTVPALVAEHSMEAPVRLGLRQNWEQFTLLVAVNAFVGAMVGLERATLPLVARAEFGQASALAALSFIATFGFSKAVANLMAGMASERFGRRAVLLAGWTLAIPVPFAILIAPSWCWIVAANALLGASQGLAWSATVIMKIDLVGPRQRGLAMGLNEFAGYFALGMAALLSGMVAAKFGLRAGPAYAGVAVAFCGLILSLFARDTTCYARLEHALVTADHSADRTAWRQSVPKTRDYFGTLLRVKGPLFNLNQAGLVNNLNDGMAWGLFPILFAGAHLSLVEGSALVASYPIVWGIAQLFTGAMSDQVGRKQLIVAGMMLQGIALILLALTPTQLAWWISIIGLGIGTALVYPTLIAAVNDSVAPAWRGAAVGAYRFWRDSGYVVGAVGAGIVADAFGVSTTIVIVGTITILSGVLVAARYVDRNHGGLQNAVAA